MNLKTLTLLLTPSLFMLLLLSCGGTPLTSEEALTKRAESWSLATSNEDWMEQYKYLSPRSREVCKSGNYATHIGMEIGIFKRFMSIPEDEKVTFSILHVTVGGDIGRVYPEKKHDGNVIKFEGDEGSGWVYVDGEWWQEEYDWETTCGPDDL